MSDGPLSPEEVAHRGFGTTFRGFDTADVRAYLQRVANELRASTARERDLHRRLAEAEHRAAHPVIEGDALTRALGDEMGRILASAQQAAMGLKEKAEENSARILREAHDQAQRIRAQAEAILAVRTEEADGEAAEIRRAAETEAAGVVERAGREADAAMAEVEGRARQLVHDAQAARARVLGDLTRRRRLLQTQVEQLRAGRERLLEAYRVVRRTTDDVADELQRVEDEAREAAGVAGERVAAEPGGDDAEEALLPADPGAGGPSDAAGGPSEGGVGRGPGGVGAGSSGAEGATAAPEASVPPEVKAEMAAQRAARAAEAAESVVLATEAAAVEMAGQAAADHPGEALPQIVSTRPGGTGDRRSLRLLRRPRIEGPPPDVVVAPPGDEGVRVIPPAPGAGTTAVPAAAEVATADSAAAEPASAGGDERAGTPIVPDAEPGPPPRPAAQEDRPVAADAVVPDPVAGGEAEAATAVAGVDELFARIRAGRADAVARAHEVLAADRSAPAETSSDPEPSAAPEPVAPAGVRPAGPADEEALLRHRDTAVDGLESKLARKLKRALQDEQNEVLDRLRSVRVGTGPEAVLPAPGAQAERYRQAVGDLLRTSAAAGVALVVPLEDARPEPPDVADVETTLAASLAEPLRRALERALGGDGTDQGAVVECIGAAYREWKGQRIESLAGDAVTAAFSRGALAAMPPGTSSRWVVDDDGRPCPDCDDNALAGRTPAGEVFPTGQAHPPAHTGCRCLLAPAELAAVAPGRG